MAGRFLTHPDLSRQMQRKRLSSAIHGLTLSLSSAESSKIPPLADKSWIKCACIWWFVSDESNAAWTPAFDR